MSETKKTALTDAPPLKTGDAGGILLIALDAAGMVLILLSVRKREKRR